MLVTDLLADVIHHMHHLLHVRVGLQVVRVTDVEDARVVQELRRQPTHLQVQLN
jgi:hypothetical protein